MSSINFKSLSFQIFDRFLSFCVAIKTIARNIKKTKLEPECHILPRLVQGNDVCIDVGAGYGRIAYLLSQLVGSQGMIYCFEPGNFSFRVLRDITFFHGLKNVKIFKVALSDKPCVAQLIIPVKAGNSKPGPSLAYLNSVVKSIPEHVVQKAVQVINLDTFVKENQLTRLDFLKCDVEGSELLFLKGALTTIERFKPILLMEVDRDLMSRFGNTPEELFNLLESQGYAVFLLKDSAFEKVESYVNGEINYFFFHSSMSSKIVKTN